MRVPRAVSLLALERRRISAGEVVREVQGMEDADGDDGPSSESVLAAKVIGPFWDELESELMQRLESVSIEELCLRAEQQAVESEGRRSFDFVI